MFVNLYTIAVLDLTNVGPIGGLIVSQAGDKVQMQLASVDRHRNLNFLVSHQFVVSRYSIECAASLNYVIACSHIMQCEQDMARGVDYSMLSHSAEPLIGWLGSNGVSLLQDCVSITFE